MQRVLIIGCPGAGKSTFARKLRDKTGLPLIYLDILRHRPDKTTVPAEEFDRQLQRILDTDRWIIDGNYRRTMERRLEACDTVIFLDFPTDVCIAGAEERIGLQREDLPFRASLEDEFRQRIMGFAESDVPEIRRLLAGCAGRKRVVVFRSREEADRFADSL